MAKKVHLHGNIVSLPVRCRTQIACKGALLVETAAIELSRVNLYVPAHTEWIIDVTLTKAGRDYMRAHHHVSAFIAAAYHKQLEGRSDVDTISFTVVS